MRKSNLTNTLVIISDQCDGVYEDKWKKDVLHYTGMGLNGDQDINYMQNKTVNESKINGIDMFLFEVYKKGEYVYRGRVELADKPYIAKQLDQQKKMRNVWIFPLRIVDVDDYITGDFIYRQSEIKRKKAHRLQDKELLEIADCIQGTPGVREIKTSVYQRSEYVVEFAKRRAKGKCQLCGKEAPFKNKNGEAYLEVHHIVWLSNGGEDTINNAVALCPNCHRKMHALNLKEDIEKLQNVVEEFRNDFKY